MATIQVDPIILERNLQTGVSKVEGALGDLVRSAGITDRVLARATQYVRSESAKVRSTASALSSKARGLKNAGVSLANRAGTLTIEGRERLRSIREDPAWVNLLSTSWEKLGWRSAEVLRARAKSVESLTKDLFTLNATMKNHIAALSSLMRDLNGLEGFAQGKGFRAATEQFTGFYGGTITRVATIGAVGLIAYLMLPGILARTSRRARA